MRGCESLQFHTLHPTLILLNTYPSCVHRHFRILDTHPFPSLSLHSANMQAVARRGVSARPAIRAARASARPVKAMAFQVTLKTPSGRAPRQLRVVMAYKRCLRDSMAVRCRLRRWVSRRLAGNATCRGAWSVCSMALPHPHAFLPGDKTIECSPDTYILDAAEVSIWMALHHPVILV